MSKYYQIISSLNIKEVGRFPQCESALWDGQRFKNDSFAYKGKFGAISGKPSLPKPILHRNSKTTDFLSFSFLQDNIFKIISIDFFNFLKPYLNEYQIWDIKVSNDVYKFDRKNVNYILKQEPKQELYPYKILHISYPESSFIDYNSSTFYTYKQYNEFVDFDQDKTLTDFLRKYYENDSIEKGQKIKIPKKILVEDNIKVKSKNELRALIDSLIQLKVGTPLERLSEVPKLGVKKIVFNCSDYEKDIFRVFIRAGSGINGYYVSENLKNKIQEQGFTGMDFKPLHELNPHIDIECI